MEPINELLLLLRVIYAGFLGTLIGIERKGGTAGPGMRTFSLICMGSALFTVLSVEGFQGDYEPSRIASQIVTGIGFIGAGVIWRQKEEAIHGITTAAAIWVSASVGIACGLGMYIIASLVTLIVMFILSRGHPIKAASENIKYETITT